MNEARYRYIALHYLNNGRGVAIAEKCPNEA